MAALTFTICCLLFVEANTISTSVPNDPVLTSPTIKTTTGPVQGLIIPSSLTSHPVHAYYGIPFALPPLGPLRFKPPVQVPRWNKTYSAIRKPNSCPQPQQPGSFPGFAGDAVWYANTPISEDCLYLNIWVPEEVLESSEPAPVMFWFHGGALFFGTSTSDVFQGENLASENGVVVVSTQYRLGPLGFLYLSTEDAPGNVGLLDQVLAMEWIKSNIKEFGGDPDRITIFGESAGGASVEYHLLSPMSRSLFNSGIIMSGTYASRFQSQSEALNSSLELASHVGCYDQGQELDKETLQDVVACLHSTPAMDLALKQMQDYHKALRSPFVATVDGTFLKDTPLKLLGKGNVKRTPIMIGDVRDEGTFFMPGSFPKMRSIYEPAFISYDEMQEYLDQIFADRSAAERAAILQEYTNWVNPDDGYTNQRQIASAAGDAFLVCPSRKFADGWSSLGLGVYFYSFTHRTSSSPWAEWYGVRHTDEIEYVFGNLAPETHTEEEMEHSRRMMKLFTDFAKYGTPNGAGQESSGCDWKEYTSAKPVYMELDTGSNWTTSEAMLGPRARECAFWNRYLPKLGAQNDCTIVDALTIVI